MKIQVILVGKTDPLWLKAQDHYLHRLKPHVSIDWVVVAEEKGSDAQCSRVIVAERERIMQKIHPQDFVVLCDEKGQRFTSEGMAAMIRGHRDGGQVKRMIFVIGGVFGLNATEWPNPDLVMSLSDMTFTHQMVRIFLLEQIYRSYLILKGHKYHKT